MKALKFIKGKLGYGVGATGLDLSYGMFYSFLAKYLTDVLGLKAGFLLVLTSVARIWDGINDPMMGTIVDNTHTKMGKYRPWVLRGALCNSVVLVLLFTNPLKLTGVALMAYIVVMYVAWGMTNTMADIPYWSMVPSFTSDPEERNLISTIARSFSGIGQGIVSIGAPLLMSAVSLSEDANGNTVHDERSYFVAALVSAICLVLFAGLSVFTTKERVATKASEKFSLKKAFSVIKSNDQLLVFMVFAMISNAGWYLTSGVATYYFDVVVGDAGKQGMFSTFQAIGSVIGMVLLIVLTKFMSKRKSYQTSLLIVFIGYVGMSVCAFANDFSGNLTDDQVSMMLLPMNIFYLISGIGMSSMFTAQTIFLADVVDYGEFKLGFRAESITFSMKGFLQKMAYTLQTIILFASLGISKYDGALHSQNSEGAKTAITLMLSVIPAALFFISFIVFTRKFKLHGDLMDQVTAFATQKRLEAEAEASEA